MPRNALLSLLLSLSIFWSGCSRQVPPAQFTSAPPTATSPSSAPLTETFTLAAATPVPPAPLPPAVTPANQPTSVSEILARLDGLSIDAFFDEAYKQWLLRDPETVTALGLAQTYGVGNDRLTNISDAYIRETQALESGILALLQKYDRAALTPEQALTAEVYAWWLDDRVRGQAFMYNDYPVNQIVYSLHYGLLQFFTDLRPVASLQDVQDYITCLSQVKAKIDQAIDGLQRREAAGVILPRYLVLQTRSDLQSIALSSAPATPFYAALAEKMSKLKDLTAADQGVLLKAAEKEINTSVLPGFQALVAYFDHLATVATDDAGVWKFSNGEAYYAYVLRHHTTTEMTPDELHALGLRELDRIHAEMRAVFDQLGYPQSASLAALYNRAAQAGGMLTSQEVIPAAESLIQGAEAKTGPAFDLYPKASVAVIAGTGRTGNYYTQPAFDGSRPGLFYVGMWPQPKASLAATVYHETIPGHHLQMALAQELNLPAVRRAMDFNAYIEGWALYAERLTGELDFYKDDPYGNLARLQLEALRAARLVVDTGLHAKKWTRDQAVAFMLENVGQPNEGEVDRYIVAPGQATSYYAGYVRLLALRQKAKDALGDKFDLRAFHNAVLGHGALPLDILDKQVMASLQTSH